MYISQFQIKVHPWRKVKQQELKVSSHTLSQEQRKVTLSLLSILK